MGETFDILMITHATLCQGYKDALHLILDIENSDLETLSYEAGEALDTFKQRVENMIEIKYKDRNIVVLFDLPGGSPANVALPFISSSRKYIAGINLPFVLELMVAKKNGCLWEDLNIEEMIENATNNMVFYNKLLNMEGIYD